MAERSSEIIDVTTWTGEECYRWFASVHEKHQLPFPRFLPGAFQNLNGNYLMQFTEENFNDWVPGYGTLFYTEFKRFLVCKHQNPDPLLINMMRIYVFQGIPKEELDIYLNVPAKPDDWLTELLNKTSFEEVPLEELDIYLPGTTQNPPKTPTAMSGTAWGHSENDPQKLSSRSSLVSDPQEVLSVPSKGDLYSGNNIIPGASSSSIGTGSLSYADPTKYFNQTSCYTYPSPQGSATYPEYGGNQFANKGYMRPYEDASSSRNYSYASSATQWSPVNSATDCSRKSTPNTTFDASRMLSQDCYGNYRSYVDPLSASQPSAVQPPQNLSSMAASTSSRGRKDCGFETWQFIVQTLVKGRADLVRWEDKSTYSIRLVNPQALADLWNIHQKKTYVPYSSFTRGLRHIYAIVDQQRFPGRHIYRLGPKAIQYLHTLRRDLHSG